MAKCSSIDAVHNLFKKVWQSPQNWDTIDDLYGRNTLAAEQMKGLN